MVLPRMMDLSVEFPVGGSSVRHPILDDICLGTRGMVPFNEASLKSGSTGPAREIVLVSDHNTRCTDPSAGVH